MLILLPPSETKWRPSRGRPLDLSTLSHPGLTDPRRELIAAVGAVAQADPDAAARALELGPSQRDWVETDTRLLEAPTTTAARVYTGVLYDALGLDRADGAVRRRAASRVRVVSALFGLVSPTDRIPAYRLSGGTTWPGLGPVARFWRPAVSVELDAAARKGLVVDLRSGAYAGFWRPDPVAAKRTVELRVVLSDGRRTPVSHQNKATKGRLVADLLADGRNPGSRTGLGDVLTDLGWRVERTTTGLDIVVDSAHA